MNDKLVQDIMVPVEEYPCLSETLTLQDAILEMAVQILRNQELSVPRVALVFDDNFRDLLGILRRRDIMRGLEPRFLLSGAMDYQRKLFNVEVDPNLLGFSYHKMVTHLRKRANRLVRQFMVPIKATINYDDHILKAMCEMVDWNASLLPVIKQKRVVGVVRSMDVLREISLILSS